MPPNAALQPMPETDSADLLIAPTPTGPMRTGDGFTGVYLNAQDARDAAFLMEHVLHFFNRGEAPDKYTLSRMRALMETLRSQRTPTQVERR